MGSEGPRFTVRGVGGVFDPICARGGSIPHFRNSRVAAQLKDQELKVLAWAAACGLAFKGLEQRA